ncbi:MAG: hypothetical protein ACYTEQ_27645, partial [Planctomycetota bacterium]
MTKASVNTTMDCENRIVKIRRGPNRTAVVEFAYDASGRAIEKKDLVASPNTRRYYHGGRCWWNTACSRGSCLFDEDQLSDIDCPGLCLRQKKVENLRPVKCADRKITAADGQVRRIGDYRGYLTV